MNSACAISSRPIARIHCAPKVSCSPVRAVTAPKAFVARARWWFAASSHLDPRAPRHDCRFHVECAERAKESRCPGDDIGLFWRPARRNPLDLPANGADRLLLLVFRHRAEQLQSLGEIAGTISLGRFVTLPNPLIDGALVLTRGPRVRGRRQNQGDDREKGDRPEKHAVVSSVADR